MVLPGPIDSVAWTPPAAPVLEGPWSPNEALRAATKLHEALPAGPEDVEVFPDGTVWAGTAAGGIYRIPPGGEPALVVDTGGHPLGMDRAPDGTLIVCDAYKGLLRVHDDGRLEVLTTEAEGVPFRFTDDVAVAKDGTIYFSDASSKYEQPDYPLDLLESRPYGRLLAYDPTTKETRVLLRDLHFANGVALDADERFLLVNETWRYRVQRYWLQGPKAGTAEMFIENLPGMPDGIARNPRGTFWVALYTVRKPILDAIHDKPLVKELIPKLPRSMWPKPIRYGLAAELDGDGRVVRSVHDPGGQTVLEVTSVEEHEGALYLGTLKAPGGWRVSLGG